MGETKGLLVVPLAWNPDDDLRALELDADDALKIAFGDASKGLVGLHGWIASAWQKNPLAFGYSDTISEALADTNLPAGGSTLTGDTVPAGEIWVVTSCSIQYTGTPPTNIFVRQSVSGVNVVLIDEHNVVSGTWYSYAGWMVLAEDDGMDANVVGATLGDDLKFRYAGFKIDIDQ